jgi:S-adenosylmethionine decarboxylase
MRYLGRHFIAELYDCDRKVLDDLELIGARMREAAEAARAKVIDAVFHRFSPHGVSGVVVIAESHLSIHTWPEFGYAAVDIFTCGEECRPEAGIDLLGAALGARRRELRMLERGFAEQVLGGRTSEVRFVHKPVAASP